MTVIQFSDSDIPTDEAPITAMPEGTTSYDPEFPGSTPDAPYGYKADGTPRKRRPNGSGTAAAPTKRSGGRGSESSARAAAGMLAQINNLVGLSLMGFGFSMTGQALTDANERFETLAMEALKTDPALCKKIMSAGATSGRTALFMAYGYLGMNIIPAMRMELAQRKAERGEDETYE